MTSLWSDWTENPYNTGEFRQLVQTRRSMKTGVVRNIFHETQPVSLCWNLWDCAWSQREQQWAQECILSYKALPVLPTPVSPSEMAKRWGCSHTWARKLILGSWDWVGVSDRHYVHASWIKDGWIWRACLEHENPLASISAVNKLREYVPAQDDCRPAGIESVSRWVGIEAFAHLREARILQGCPSLQDRHKMYYVPQKRSETRMVAAMRAESKGE